ncbi:MAG: PEP-CTERM sorting domain-containing protein [Verrucomicrobia bacterium]|nr:PEP-CTERM sorting domain-containing protein [Verrucomicrobiota bacterium]
MYSLSQRTSRFIVGLLMLVGVCHADIILNPIDRGTYSATGNHDPNYHNYIIGGSSSGHDFISNNFFVFDLSGLSAQVISAEFWIESNWYLSADPSETFTVYDITGSIPAIRDGSAGVAGFTDMQSGNAYGDISVSSADNGTMLSITLNAQAIQNINAGLGGQFAIGGTVSTLDLITPREEQIFGPTNPDNPADGVDLRLTIIPEPSVLGLLIVGCGMLALRRRRIR